MVIGEMVVTGTGEQRETHFVSGMVWPAGVGR